MSSLANCPRLALALNSRIPCTRLSALCREALVLSLLNRFYSVLCFFANRSITIISVLFFEYEYEQNCLLQTVLYHEDLQRRLYGHLKYNYSRLDDFMDTDEYLMRRVSLQ